MRKFEERFGSTVLVFDSPSEAAAACNRGLFRHDEQKLGRRLPSWDAVLQAIDQPWKEGLEAVEKFVRELEEKPLPEIKSIVRRIRYTEDDGDEIDLDRMRAGQSYWRVSRRETTVGPTEVTIVVNLSASKDISATDILWRGAAAVAMAKILEDRGFSVALWAVQTSCPFSGNEWKRLSIAIQLKNFGERLDLSTLVNCVSAWFYRSVLFTLVRTMVPKLGESLAQGLGTPETPYQEELNYFSSPENRLYSMSSHSYYGALAAVQHSFEKVHDSQQPPVEIIEEDPTPAPQQEQGGTQPPKKDTPPPPPQKQRKPKKPPTIKERKYKAVKRITQD